MKLNQNIFPISLNSVQESFEIMNFQLWKLSKKFTYLIRRVKHR